MTLVSWTRLSRKWHRWGAWSVGLIVLLWTITGVIMITPSLPPGGSGDPTEIGPIDSDIVSPAVAIKSLELSPEARVRALALRSVGGRTSYDITLARGGSRLVDAHTGLPYEVDSVLAPRVALDVFGRTVGVASVVRVSRADARYRGPLPAWRVEFDDAHHTLAHVTRYGTVSFVDSWLAFKQAAGSMHTFTLPRLAWPKGNARRGALVVAGAITVALSLTGFVMLIPVRRKTT